MKTPFFASLEFRRAIRSHMRFLQSDYRPKTYKLAKWQPFGNGQIVISCHISDECGQTYSAPNFNTATGKTFLFA